MPNTDPAGAVKARVAAWTSAAFTALNTAGQAGRDVHTLTMSGIGACRRWCAYTLAGTPVSDRPGGEYRAAVLGSGIHNFYLPALAEVAGDAHIEVAVQLHVAGLTITGHADFIHVDPKTGEAQVGDLKTVREWKLHGIIRDGQASYQHRLQVYAYALAAAQAGYNVRWVWWLYLDRSTGKTEIIVEPFTNVRAYAVDQRITHLLTLATDPDAVIRDNRGPGLAPACDGCPWLRRCWGPDARPGVAGPQKILAHSEPAIIEALEGLFQASGAATWAEGEKEFWKLVLADVPDGRYGSYTLRRRNSGRALDHVKTKELMETAGLTPPMKEREAAMLVGRL